MKKTIFMLCAALISISLLFTACGKNTGTDMDKTSGKATTTTRPAGELTSANETTGKGAAESIGDDIMTTLRNGATTVKDGLESIGNDISEAV